MRKVFKTLLVPLLFAGASQAFYLPGVAPHDYKSGEKVLLNVNSLTPSSNQQQVNSVISFDYYNDHFHFCKPPKGTQRQSESLGSVLFGDRIFNSAFELNMRTDEECKLLCETEPIPKDDAKFINDRIREGYAFNWNVDGLPAANEQIDPQTEEKYYNIGFKLGTVVNDTPYLNNHYDIIIHYHVTSTGLSRVVGVSVNPSSKATKPNHACAKGLGNFHLSEDGKTPVVYTYSVTWIPSDTVWATRWDGYLRVLDPSIHWFSLINSSVIVLFLTGMVTMILLRALHKDITRYNAVDAQEDVQEDYGWKLVHGDVFRPPSRPMLLSILAGSGIQLSVMVGLTLVFAVLGFLSPSNRGSLATMMILFFMVFSCVSGYISARIYKMNGGEMWKTNMILTATIVPGTLIGGLLALNFFLIYSDASGAVPFPTMLAIAGLWLIIALPLSVTGSYIGLRKPRIEQPVRTNQIPRQIPDQPVYMQALPSILMGGILPFGAIFIELYYIMNSIWFHRIYYGIGFLFLVFAVLVMTCSLIAVLMCYFHMCNEDYHWSWRAFFTAGATGFYVYAYSFLYYFTKLNINTFTSTVLYFGYSSMISVLLFVMTGSIGYLSCLFFLRKIFASIKVD